jgi:hypothetical protein
MKLNNQEFKVMPNGDVKAIQSYEAKPVVQAINGVDVTLGEQPAYEVINVVNKDKIPELLEYLKGQESEVQKRIDSAKEVIKKNEFLDCEVLSAAIMKIPRDKLNTKKLVEVNNLVQDFYMKKGAIENLVLLEANIELFTKQIEFFTNLV